jgi:hypothetical protein
VAREPVAARFFLAVYGYAGLVGELIRGTPEARAERGARLHREVMAAVAAGTLDAWVEAVLARRPR